MQTKIIQFADKIHPILWQLICFTVSIILFSLALRHPPAGFLRHLSLSLRIDFWPVIPITALAVYLLFRIPGRFGNLIAVTSTLFLFAMPLAGLWAYGHTQSGMLGGIIPLSDAQNYYNDAIRLTTGANFSFFSSRRPLFPGFLSILLALTNYNLLMSLAILSALTAVSCYLMTREVQRTHGTEAAVFLLMMVFLYQRLHSGVVMSEIFGIALGTLGFTILWRGAADKKIQTIWFGIFSTTLALNARAGAFFILPLLVIWAGRLFRADKFISWKTIGVTSSAIVLGFASSILMGRIIGQPSGIPFGNFSYTLYSLAAGGKSWVAIYDVHPEVFLLPEPDHTKKVFQLAFELIREKPFLTLQGAIFFWKSIFSDTLYNVFAFVYKENWTISPIVKWSLYLLSILGIFAWLRDKRSPFNSLLMVCILGIFISVPFAPPTDSFRMRPYAASTAMISALPALGIWSIINRTKLKMLKPVDVDRSLDLLTNYFSAALILVTLIGPFIVKLTGSQKEIPLSSCDSPLSSILIRFDQGAYLNLVKNTADFADWPPNYHNYIFRRNAHSIEDVNLIEWAQSIPSSQTIMTTLDLTTMSDTLIVLPTKFLPEFGEYIQLCGQHESAPSLKRYNIFYAEQAISVSK